MIQRIQTVWLALAAMCLGGLFLVKDQFFRVGEIADPKNLEHFIFDQPLVKAMFGLTILVAIAAIFLFKNRVAQIRAVKFGFFNILMAFVFGGLSGYSINKASLEKNGSAYFETGWAAVLPILAIIFLWLALRAIQKDEKLVKSMDRLR